MQALVVPVLGWEEITLSARVIVAIAALGILGTGLAYILYFRLIADLGATAASSVNYVVPVAAIAAGFLILGEPLSLPVIVGALVVIGCVIYSRGQRRVAPAAPAAAQRAEAER